MAASSSQASPADVEPEPVQEISSKDMISMSLGMVMKNKNEEGVGWDRVQEFVTFVVDKEKMPNRHGVIRDANRFYQQWTDDAMVDAKQLLTNDEEVEECRLFCMVHPGSGMEEGKDYDSTGRRFKMKVSTALHFKMTRMDVAGNGKRFRDVFMELLRKLGQWWLHFGQQQAWNETYQHKWQTNTERNRQACMKAIQAAVRKRTGNADLTLQQQTAANKKARAVAGLATHPP